MADALEHEREAVARLEAADRVKDELVSTISHELRTPITSIHGYSELLADGSLGEMNPGQTDALAKVLRNTSRLEVLVEDLLFVAKAEAGELTLRLVPVDVREVVGQAREVLEQMCRDRELEVRFELPVEEVPVDRRPARPRADRDQPRRQRDQVHPRRRDRHRRRPARGGRRHPDRHRHRDRDRRGRPVAAVPAVLPRRPRPTGWPSPAPGWASASCRGSSPATAARSAWSRRSDAAPASTCTCPRHAPCPDRPPLPAPQA